MHLKNLPGFVRYVNHVFYAEVVNDEIIPPPIPHPYGVLIVESPKLTEQLAINIDHKIDFYNFWLLVDKGLHDIPEWEVLIRYKPVKGLKGLVKKMWPKLEYLVFTRGQLEKLLSDDLSELQAAYRTAPRFRFYADE